MGLLLTELAYHCSTSIIDKHCCTILNLKSEGVKSWRNTETMTDFIVDICLMLNHSVEVASILVYVSTHKCMNGLVSVCQQAGRRAMFLPGGGWMQGTGCSPFPDQSLQQFGHRGREKEASHPQYHRCGRDGLKMAVALKRRAMESW